MFFWGMKVQMYVYASYQRQNSAAEVSAQMYIL